MKQVVLAFAFLALIAVGCSEPVADNPVADKPDAGLATSGELLAKVDKAGLESVIADNPIVLVEFTADW